MEAFENEWIEVEFQNVESCNNIQEESDVPKFFRETVEATFFDDGPIYKQTHLEIDGSSKSDRIEWAHIRYHNKMTPGYAFEIVVQWLIASGPIVYDLIYVWNRKALQCGYQIVPIPADPLAEPFTDKSDPLRGPIFVPLNICSLEKDGKALFKGNNCTVCFLNKIKKISQK